MNTRGNQQQAYPSAHLHMISIVIIYAFFAIYFFKQAFLQHSFTEILFSGLLGAFIWTFVEYLVHRFLLHSKPERTLLKKFQFYMHGEHHLHPTDPKRFLVPLFVSLPASTLSYVGFKLIFSSYADPIFAGYILGYILYDFVHYSVHYFRCQSRIGKWFKQYHFRHHFKENDRYFGVSNPLWDYVLFTAKLGKRK